MLNKNGYAFEEYYVLTTTSLVINISLLAGISWRTYHPYNSKCCLSFIQRATHSHKISFCQSDIHADNREPQPSVVPIARLVALTIKPLLDYILIIFNPLLGIFVGVAAIFLVHQHNLTHLLGRPLEGIKDGVGFWHVIF